MPLPIASKNLQEDLTVIEGQLTNVSTAIGALPATPLEADLPDIVQIVADLTTAAEALQVAVAAILVTLSTTRINQ